MCKSIFRQYFTLPHYSISLHYKFVPRSFTQFPSITNIRPSTPQDSLRACIWFLLQTLWYVAYIASFFLPRGCRVHSYLTEVPKYLVCSCCFSYAFQMVKDVTNRTESGDARIARPSRTRFKGPRPRPRMSRPVMYPEHLHLAALWKRARNATEEDREA